jgi:hypothetical protein
MKERPPIWRVAVNKLNKQPRKPTSGGPPALGFGEVLTTPSRENVPAMNYSQWDCFTLMRCFLEIKQSLGKQRTPPRGSPGGGGECFQREYLEVLKSGKGTFC